MFSAAIKDCGHRRWHFQGGPGRTGRECKRDPAVGDLECNATKGIWRQGDYGSPRSGYRRAKASRIAARKSLRWKRNAPTWPAPSQRIVEPGQWACSMAAEAGGI